MCQMMGGKTLSWTWLSQGGPITWLVVIFGLLVVVALLLAGAALAEALVGFVARLWRSRDARA